MKLWQKTSLICIGVLTIIVVSCSTILLVHSKNSILEFAYQHAKAKQHDLAASFSEMANYYLSDDNSQAVKSSLVQYCFTRFSDPSSVLMEGNETLFSGVGVNPTDYLSLQENIYEAQLVETEIMDRNILIVGSRVAVQGQFYSVYVVEDISTVYNSIVDILWAFAWVTIAGIILGAALIMLLMRRSTKPLTVLAGAARHIVQIV